MCEYVEGCSLSDDPIALLLWKAPKSRAEWLIVCTGKRRCPLAAVFKLPSGLVTCTPPVKWRDGSLFVDPKDPNDVTHGHAALRPLDSWEETEEDYGRCACGTWSFRPARSARVLTTDAKGRRIAFASYVRMADAQPRIEP